MAEVRIRSKAYRTASGSSLDVLRDVAFALPEGGITCLVGPSGCGKTTLLRIMLGLDRDFDGAVLLPPGRVAAVFQEPRLLPWRTVRRNLELAAPERAATVDPLLAGVGLDGTAALYPGELSLGMARRAALARAFIVEPSLLVLDEPFASLDEATAALTRSALTDLWRARPTTTLMVTHDLVDAARLADRIVVLSPRPATVLAVHDVEKPFDSRDAGDIARTAATVSASAS